MVKVESAFINNMYLYKVGKRLELQKHIWSTDPSHKDWSPPFSLKADKPMSLRSTGKNVADCVESLIGAFFLSNNLRKTLEFISGIGLIPLKEARILDKIPDKDLRFSLNPNLDAY